jgi:hypothetical protein
MTPDATTQAATSRAAWVKAEVRRRMDPRGVTVEQHAKATAHAEREWAKRHPALAKVLAGAVAS